MTNEEVRPFIGRAVCVTTIDGRVIAGTLHSGHGNPDGHYAVVSATRSSGGGVSSESLHPAWEIKHIEPATFGRRTAFTCVCAIGNPDPQPS